MKPKILKVDHCFPKKAAHALELVAPVYGRTFAFGKDDLDRCFPEAIEAVRTIGVNIETFGRFGWERLLIGSADGNVGGLRLVGSKTKLSKMLVLVGEDLSYMEGILLIVRPRSVELIGPVGETPFLPHYVPVKAINDSWDYGMIISGKIKEYATGPYGLADDYRGFRFRKLEDAVMTKMFFE